MSRDGTRALATKSDVIIWIGRRHAMSYRRLAACGSAHRLPRPGCPSGVTRSRLPLFHLTWATYVNCPSTRPAALLCQRRSHAVAHVIDGRARQQQVRALRYGSLSGTSPYVPDILQNSSHSAFRIILPAKTRPTRGAMPRQAMQPADVRPRRDLPPSTLTLNTPIHRNNQTHQRLSKSNRRAQRGRRPPQ